MAIETSILDEMQLKRLATVLRFGEFDLLTGEEIEAIALTLEALAKKEALKCKKCRGHGQLITFLPDEVHSPYFIPCPDCHGTGEEPESLNSVKTEGKP
jgi:hypothetical protein